LCTFSCNAGSTGCKGWKFWTDPFSPEKMLALMLAEQGRKYRWAVLPDKFRLTSRNARNSPGILLQANETFFGTRPKVDRKFRWPDTSGLLPPNFKAEFSADVVGRGIWAELPPAQAGTCAWSRNTATAPVLRYLSIILVCSIKLCTCIHQHT
jgi:hypothetical protein